MRGGTYPPRKVWRLVTRTFTFAPCFMPGVNFHDLYADTTALSTASPADSTTWTSVTSPVSSTTKEQVTEARWPRLSCTASFGYSADLPMVLTGLAERLESFSS